MSNTPKQQAELYRKAAETIEMCAEHGIEPIVKLRKISCKLLKLDLTEEFCLFEFPLAVIEGQLVWADTIVYNPHWINGVPAHACSFTPNNDASWSLNPPKQPLCEVEGKPVYKGDKLWCGISNHRFIVKGLANGFAGLAYENTYAGRVCTSIDSCSWNPPKQTVMVELLVEDAELFGITSYATFCLENRISEACRKALDNLK